MSPWCRAVCCWGQTEWRKGQTAAARRRVLRLFPPINRNSPFGPQRKQTTAQGQRADLGRWSSDQHHKLIWSTPSAGGGLTRPRREEFRGWPPSILHLSLSLHPVQGQTPGRHRLSVPPTPSSDVAMLACQHFLVVWYLRQHFAFKALAERSPWKPRCQRKHRLETRAHFKLRINPDVTTLFCRRLFPGWRQTSELCEQRLIFHWASSRMSVWVYLLVYAWMFV